MKTEHLTVFVAGLMLLLSSCKPEHAVVPDFSKYTATNAECKLTGAIDSTDWFNDVLNLGADTSYLKFADNIVLTDSTAGVISIAPVCPNPSNGFFIWNVSSTRQCKLKLVCINLNSDVLYYNAYLLQGGPLEIAFDFRNNSAFHANTNYRMYYAFYTVTDSAYYSGHGDFRIQ